VAPASASTKIWHQFQLHSIKKVAPWFRLQLRLRFLYHVFKHPVISESYNFYNSANLLLITNNSAPTKRERIQTVFEEYAEMTCIRFTQRTNQREYLKIDGTGGCSSYVGRQTQFRDGQEVRKK